jgi:hypothetical protein
MCFRDPPAKWVRLLHKTRETGVCPFGKLMPILYALVSRESCVLAEFTAVTGNFQQVTRLILQQRPNEDGYNSGAYEE